MNISNLKIENFIGIRHLDINIDVPVLLVAGHNGAGKSTIRDAVRFLLTGEPARVSRKKDLPALLPEGVKKGSVQALIDDVACSRDVKTGKGDTDVATSPQLPYVIDADKFGMLSNKDRRRFLMDMMGVKADHNALAQTLKDRGHDADKVESVKPLMRSGFEAAEKYAQDAAKEARAVWKHITGETYGDMKAEGWTAPTPEVELGNMEAAEARGKELSAQLTEAEREMGALRHQLDTASEKSDERQRLKLLVSDLEANQQWYAKACEQVNAAEKRVREAESAIPNKATSHPCPSCGTHLIFDGGELVEHKGAASAEEIEKLDKAFREAQAALNDAEAEADDAFAKKQASQTAQARLEALGDAPDLQDLQERYAAAEKRANDIQAEIEEARAAYQKMAADARALGEAEKKTKRAAAEHQNVQEWKELAEACSPAGIAAEILKETLGPLHARLETSHKTTGWPQVRLDGEMDIYYGDRPYELLSESERWRADAMLAEAIAHLSDLRFLVLDRLDVLDPAGRAPALKWLSELGETYDTIIVAATLKAEPTSLPPNIGTIWMERGADIKQVAA